MRTTLSLSLGASLLLLGCNEPPGEAVVAIGPEGATTTDVLVADILEDAPDPNARDEVTYTYSWTRDGQDAGIDGPEVPAEETSSGQVWRVSVVASDGKLTGSASGASITIQNTPPTATVAITPESPLSTEDLNVSVTGEDVDGDTVNSTVVWTRDGEPAGITATRVPADRTSPGEVWEATVTPRDAQSVGEPVSASVQIENQAPTVTGIILRPQQAYERSVIEALPSTEDPDGDSVTYTYDFIVNGVNLGPSEDNTLTGESFDRGDTVAVEVVANDGLADSAPLVSDAITVLNTAPTISSVSLDVTEIFEDTTVTCTPEGYADDDGDPAQYRYEWTIDGELASTDASIDGSLFDKGSRVSCAVTPFDGADEGRSLSTRPIEVSNSLPVVSSVTISPSSPESGTEMSVTVGSTSDADGDDVTLDISWYVDSVLVSKGTTLPPGAFVRGDDIYAEVTPDDGEDEGAPVKSNVETGINSAPRITAFALTPAPIFSADRIGVALSTDDWDGDTVDVTYTWTINGTRYGSDSTMAIPSSETSKGDTVELTVTTSDGIASGDTRTQTEKVRLKIDPPVIAIDPEDPETSDDLFCEILVGSTDADGGTITYHFSWTKDGTEWTGSTSTTDYSGDTIPSSVTKDREDWECTVYASSPNAASEDATDLVTVADRDGQVRDVSGTWLDVRFEECGSGTSGCTASVAKKACTDIGMKVVSHASNGTTEVESLGATSSCNFSTSYFESDTTRSSGDCLVGISNLEWSSCCTTSRWHGRTMKFASGGTIFGYVASSNSGYVSSYPSTAGDTWGCQSLTTRADSAAPGGCSQLYVACTK